MTQPADIVAVGGGYFVHTNGSDPSKLVRLFRSAIAQLPPGVDEIIELVWKPVGPTSPHVEIVRQKVILSNDGNSAAIAMVENLGQKMRFAEGAISEVPLELGRDLVLHELAHVHTLAEKLTGIVDVSEKHQLEDAGGDSNRLLKVLEELAEKRMIAWGIRPEPIKQWTTDYLRQLELID